MHDKPETYSEALFIVFSCIPLDILPIFTVLSYHRQNIKMIDNYKQSLLNVEQEYTVSKNGSEFYYKEEEGDEHISIFN